MYRPSHMSKSAGVTALLLLVGTAWAVYPPAVKDEGKFFTAETLDKANLKIRAIYEKYRKDVVIETIPELTADQKKKLESDSKTKFFGKLAHDNAARLGLNGIYVLIVKKPTHLQVHMDPETQKKAFTANDRKELIDTMIARFKKGEFDAGLLDGLTVIEAAVERNTATKP